VASAMIRPWGQRRHERPLTAGSPARMREESCHSRRVPAASENHRDPVMAGYLSGGDPEDATEGVWPSGYRSKAGEIVMASLGGAGDSVAVVVGMGELGSATATPLARGRVHGGGRSHPESTRRDWRPEQ